MQLTDVNRRVDFFKKHRYVMMEDTKECLINSDRNKNMYPLDINMIMGKSQLYPFSKSIPNVAMTS